MYFWFLASWHLVCASLDVTGFVTGPYMHRQLLMEVCIACTWYIEEFLFGCLLPVLCSENSCMG